MTTVNGHSNARSGGSGWGLAPCNPVEWGTFFSMTTVKELCNAPQMDPRCAQHGPQDGLGRSLDWPQVACGVCESSLAGLNDAVSNPINSHPGPWEGPLTHAPRPAGGGVGGGRPVGGDHPFTLPCWNAVPPHTRQQQRPTGHGWHTRRGRATASHGCRLAVRRARFRGLQPAKGDAQLGH